jgi:hypothetical protein
MSEKQYIDQEYQPIGGEGITVLITLAAGKPFGCFLQH